MPPNGRRQVADEERVDPDHAGADRAADALGPLGRARVDDPREAVRGRVGERDALVLVGEGLERQHGAEDLALHDLALVRARARRASARRRGRRARQAGRRGRSRRRSPAHARRSPRRARGGRGGSAASPSCRRRAGRRGRARRRSGGRARGTASATDSCTSSRVPARQTWPASSYWPAAFRAAASRSQSSNTSSGPLPPSSPVKGTMFCAAATPMCRAVSGEPVNEIAADARVGDERGADLLADPLHDVEDAGREAGLGGEVGEQRAGERRPLRRLEDHRAARRRARARSSRSRA